MFWKLNGFIFDVPSPIRRFLWRQPAKKSIFLDLQNIQEFFKYKCQSFHELYLPSLLYFLPLLTDDRCNRWLIQNWVAPAKDTLANTLETKINHEPGKSINCNMFLGMQIYAMLAPVICKIFLLTAHYQKYSCYIKRLQLTQFQPKDTTGEKSQESFFSILIRIR